MNFFTKISDQRERVFTYCGSSNWLAALPPYALSSHAVIYEALPEDQTKGVPQIDVPALLLGCLAVDRSVQRQKLGEFLLIDALRHAEYLAERVGIRAVEVHATSETARHFYEHYGFMSLLDDHQHLILPISVVRHLHLHPR